MRLLSLRARIFIALIFLVVVASLLIAGVTIFQYSEQSNTYHEQRLERKENQLKKRIAYLLEDAVLAVNPQNIAAISKSKHIDDAISIHQARAKQKQYNSCQSRKRSVIENLNKNNKSGQATAHKQAAGVSRSWHATALW